MDTQSTESQSSIVVKPGVSSAIVTMVNRLANACRDAARTTQQAADLTVDPAFKEWLTQLRDVHEESVGELESTLRSQSAEVWPGHSFRSRLRRGWMRCAYSMSAGSPLVLMSACRSEEYHVQAAYELLLWILPNGPVRVVVEDRFQQFLLHRSMIPARRLPQTKQFLRQAERLQQIHSTEDVVPSPMR
ncbi:MAG: DUF2383 domain-containing protein [Rhodopirellula sp.]|nr:DUF2383 domain-containing protein [Rhodopirellula sp.]